MKLRPLILASAFAAPLAHATTITGSGGTGGAQFVTSAGAFLTTANTTFQVGSYDTTNGFVQFAAADATPIAISSVASLQGRWAGNFADTSSEANVFGGKQIAVRVTVDIGGGNFVSALYLSTANFPANGGGVGDSFNLNASTLTTLVSNLSSPGSSAYQAPNGTYPTGFVVVGVPETSTSLLTALGVVALVRRRRRA